MASQTIKTSNKKLSSITHIQVKNIFENYLDKTESFEITKAQASELLSKVYAPYQKVKQKIVPASDSEIEQAGFVRAIDSKIIRKYCIGSHYISFRKAGSASLDRINKGCPCKGHTILEKSIKVTGRYEDGSAKWTYRYQEGLESLGGLIGHSTKMENGEKVLEGVWACENKNETVISLEDALKNPEICFTGDYDMHDLMNRNGQRFIPNTIDERNAINKLNSMILHNDENFFKGKLKKEELRINKVTSFAGAKEIREIISKLSHNPYALIRHGAQTSFMSFMMDNLGKDDFKATMESIPFDKYELPAESSVVKVDDNIVIYNPKGEAFILDSPEKIYYYYKDNKLLNKVPFYYFFDDAKRKMSNREKEKNTEVDQRLLASSEKNIHRLLLKKLILMNPNEYF